MSFSCFLFQLCWDVISSRTWNKSLFSFRKLCSLTCYWDCLGIRQPHTHTLKKYNAEMPGGEATVLELSEVSSTPLLLLPIINQCPHLRTVKINMKSSLNKFQLIQYIVKLATVVEVNQKAPFSIATTLDCSTLLLICTLFCWVLNQSQVDMLLKSIINMMYRSFFFPYFQVQHLTSWILPLCVWLEQMYQCPMLKFWKMEPSPSNLI